MAAPVAQPAGTLEGVVDTVAPVTAGVGTLLNNLLGFTGSGSSTRRRRDGALEGVVDLVAPVTAGVGTLLNNLLGFTGSGSNTRR
ncbi:hypothetical protein H4R19_000339 [Coemansia spiralis]|nr:hypothetical protein H4R19_000339 [Coemansia spiralis]